MSDKEKYLPLYVRISILLVGLLAFFYIIIVAKNIIIPLVFATIIAVVLHPVVNYLVKHHINRIIAITLTLFTASVIFLVTGTALLRQMSQFSLSLPMISDKLAALFSQSTSWFSENFGINAAVITEQIAKIKSQLLNNSTMAIGQTFIALGNFIVFALLIPVYVFIILYYNQLLMEFIFRLSGLANHQKVSEVISQIKKLVQRYLIGLAIEASIVATLNIAALLILGIEYAVMLGILGALLNVIPYVGGLIGVALPMMVALATESSPWYALYVMILYYVIQIIDNNYIVPIIVSSKVKINALFSIIVVLVGNALWGIPGMFLSIPLLAIVKLIFDQIDSMKPFGFLLGDTMPPIIKIKPISQLFKKKSHD